MRYMSVLIDLITLHQVLKDMMTAIDADSSGTVSLDEWVNGGMNNVPLLVLLGLKVCKGFLFFFYVNCWPCVVSLMSFFFVDSVLLAEVMSSPGANQPMYQTKQK